MGLGYEGYILIGDGTNKDPIPATTDLSEKETALYDDGGVHGGGYGATDGRYFSVINAARGPLNTDGSINGNVFVGSGPAARAFQSLIYRALGALPTDVSLRSSGWQGATQPDAIIVSPGGGDVFQYPGVTDPDISHRALVKTLTLTGNLDGLITYTASIMSTDREPVTTGHPLSLADSFSYEPCDGSEDSNPLPFYDASVEIVDCDGNPVLVNTVPLQNLIRSWTLTIENNTVAIRTFNGSQYVYALAQGMMNVTFNFSFYSENAEFPPILNGNAASIHMGAGTKRIILPYLFYSNKSVPTGGPNDPVVETVDATGLASGTSGYAPYQSKPSAFLLGW